MRKGVDIKIQGICNKMDIFLLPMAGANMVIGIQGLKTLGQVTFDFELLMMTFMRKCRFVIWWDPHGF